MWHRSCIIPTMAEVGETMLKAKELEIQKTEMPNPLERIKDFPQLDPPSGENKGSQ